MAEHDSTDVDRLTGTATTGHEWDGIRELNTPLPRWWLWIFYATIVWSIGYWVVYPAWPLVSSFTTGTFGWNSRSEVANDLAGLKAQARRDDDEASSSSLVGNRTPIRRLLAFARARRPLGLRRQLRAVPRRRRRRRKGYRQPHR